MITKHPLFAELCPGGIASLSRHDRTQIALKNHIAQVIAQRAGAMPRAGRSLLEVGGDVGLQTQIYADLAGGFDRVVLCDWRDNRSASVREAVSFVQVDLETQPLAFADAQFDFVVCNQVLEHLKNIFMPLSQMVRVLRPGGYLILSMPNLSAWHNVALAAVGRQPSTLRLGGSHVRGYAIHSTSRFLTETGHLTLAQVDGFGLHPLTSARLPGPLKTYCHSPVWVCQRTEHQGPTWDERRRSQPTSTNFYASTGAG